MQANKQGDDFTNTIFWARSILFAACGPQVDSLIYCKRLKCPTSFKKPCYQKYIKAATCFLDVIRVRVWHNAELVEDNPGATPIKSDNVQQPQDNVQQPQDHGQQEPAVALVPKPEDEVLA